MDNMLAMPRILVVLALLVALALGIFFGVVYTGAVNVSARNYEPAPVRWMLETVRDNSVRVRAKKVGPFDLRQASSEEGVVRYKTLCEVCHGAPGVSRSPIGDGLNPLPPSLTHIAEERSDAELFWVLQNGIKMTGMPGFGESHTEGELWDIVAFLRRLPEISEEDYARMARGAEEASESDPSGAARPTGTTDPTETTAVRLESRAQTPSTE